MDRKKVSLWTVNLGLVLLLVTACSTPQPTAPPPTATSAPTATPEPPPTATAKPEPPVWNYVALGDYFVNMPGDLAYATHYAAYIEADLGVKVELNTYSSGEDTQISAKLLERIRNDKQLREKLSEAEVVTLVIGSSDLYFLLTNEYKLERCGGEDNMDCIREGVAAFKENYEAIITELFGLCHSGTIIRSMTYYYGSWEVYHFVGDTRPFIELLNEQILQTASQYNISVAQVDVAFHGSMGDEDAVSKGYILKREPGTLLPGAIKIADLYRELGYEPTVP